VEVDADRLDFNEAANDKLSLATYDASPPITLALEREADADCDKTRERLLLPEILAAVLADRLDTTLLESDSDSEAAALSSAETDKLALTDAESSAEVLPCCD
jgi:hypothetical protein